MKRFLPLLLCTLALGVFSAGSVAQAAGSKHRVDHFKVNFKGRLTGDTVYVNPAGMEPDFDLVNRVIIVTHIHHRHLKPITLILDAYLESFQSDTQPVLPDLIHPTVPLSTTLGGFFSGEAIIVGPGNSILYTGSMLAEALIDPRCLLLSPSVKKAPSYCLTERQHMQVVLYGQGAAKGGSMIMRSWFIGNKKLAVPNGSIYGKASIPAKAQKILAHGSGSLKIKQILNDFNVRFPAMRGLATGSSKPLGVQCLNSHCISPSKSQTGGRTHTTAPGLVTRNQSSSSGFFGNVRWTMVLGFALIGLALVLLVVYFWQGYRDKRKRQTVLPETPI